MLRIAICTEHNNSTLTLIRKMGIDVECNERCYKSNNFPLEATFMAENDIPSAITQNDVDIAITTSTEHPSGEYNTLRTNGTLTLIAKKNIESHITFLLDEFLTRWDAVVNAASKRKLHLCIEDKKLDNVAHILHNENLVITPVYHQGKSIVECIISEKYFWDICEELKRLDASEIALLPISKLL